ncbi:MAG TPA: TetR/AcrR family transcriptional regulator [Gemmatimonadales bacterium]
MPDAARTSPRFHRRPEARPEELLDAALAVFGERGFRQTTLEEVAARAGVSKGTVYLYFDSKDDLFRGVVNKQIVSLIESAEEMARTHAGSARELLVEMVHRMWDAMSRTDMVCMGRLVQAELTQFPEVRRFYFEHVIQRHRRLLHSIAERGVASGEFRREAVVMVPRMIPSLVMQLNQTRFLFGDLDRSAPTPRAMRDAILGLVFDGICTPGGRPRKTRPGRAAETSRRSARPHGRKKAR